MTTRRFEVAIGDSHDSLSNSAAGTLTAGHIVRVEYDDSAETFDLHNALVKDKEKILQLES